jgi:putative flippase GtrA
MISLESIVARLRPLSRKHIQLVRFGVVGSLGFVIDTAVLYIALYQFGFGYYIGRLISYLCASTVTWYLHRIFTFKVTHTKGGFKELINFQIMNSFGGGANYLVYVLLIANYSDFRAHPIMAVAIGALVGLFINFHLSKKVVFRV